MILKISSFFENFLRLVSLKNYFRCWFSQGPGYRISCLREWNCHINYCNIFWTYTGPCSHKEKQVEVVVINLEFLEDEDWILDICYSFLTAVWCWVLGQLLSFQYYSNLLTLMKNIERYHAVIVQKTRSDHFCTLVLDCLFWWPRLDDLSWP